VRARKPGDPTGRLTVPIARSYTLDDIASAHADMEAGNAAGKLVVLP
jgi:NADPH:quinone reductase-like Zn-dependent oxidoreductase